MPQQSTGLPRLPFTYQDWIRETSSTFRIRSVELKALDIFIDGYISARSASGLRNLRQAFARWKKTQGDGDAWRASSRNRSSIVTQLERELTTGDIDDMPGAPRQLVDDMANARLGLLYLFSGLKCEDAFQVTTHGVLDLAGGVLGYEGDLTSEFGMQDTSKAMHVIKEAPGVASKGLAEIRRRITSRQLLGQKPLPPASREMRATQENVNQALENIATQVSKDMAASDASGSSNDETGFKEALWDGAPGTLRVVCNILGAHFLSGALPFVSGSMSIANGLVDALYSGHARYKAYAHGRHAPVMPGYAQSIVGEIHRAMELRTCAGMYESFKGGTKIAVESLTAAAGSPVTSLVFAVMEALVSTTWKLYDIHRMQQFFAEAKHHFLIRQQPMSLYQRPVAFGRWFYRHAVGTPAISILALNSGVCGDKMRLLDMFDGGKHQIAPKDGEDIGDVHKERFIKASHYLDELKLWGQNYLEEVGYTFTTHAKDDIRGELLKTNPTPVPGDWTGTKRMLAPYQKFMTVEA